MTIIVDHALLRALVVVRRAAAPARDVRVGVDELVGGELVDRARLRLAFPVRKRRRDDLVGHGLFLLVHRVGAKDRQTALVDRGIFLSRTGEAVAGGELRHVACNVDLGEASVGREDQYALRRLAERKRLLAVRRGHFGDRKIPGTDDLLLQAFLRDRIAGAEGERKRGHSGKSHGAHPILMFNSRTSRAYFSESARAAAASFSVEPPTASVAVLASESRVG